MKNSTVYLQKPFFHILMTIEVRILDETSNMLPVVAKDSNKFKRKIEKHSMLIFKDYLSTI